MRGPQLLPNGLVPASLPAQILGFMNQNRLGLRGLAAAADVLAADCRFSLWFLTHVKGEKSANTHTQSQVREDWVISLLERGEANEKRCLAAMAVFARGGSEEHLCSELAEVAAFLNERPSLPQ